jgi:hypothetical protein
MPLALPFGGLIKQGNCTRVNITIIRQKAVSSSPLVLENPEICENGY